MKLLLNNVTKCFVITCLSWLASATTALAAPVAALEITNFTSFISGTALDSVEGWEFQANAPIRMSALGIWDLQGDGLVGSYEVGLWDSSQSLLASTTVPAGTGATLMNGFRYVSIAPIDLLAGETYTIGALYPSPLLDPYIGSDSNTTIATDPSITFLQRSRALSSTLVFPTATGINFPGAFGPNFLLTATAVPEPGSGIALLFSSMVCFVRRRRN